MAGRVRQKGNQYCAVLDDITNAFACTLEDVREQVLEQCHQETECEMMLDWVQNAVTQLWTDES